MLGLGLLFGLFVKLGPNDAVLGFEKLSESCCSLRVGWESVIDLLGQLTERLADLLKVWWQMGVFEEL